MAEILNKVPALTAGGVIGTVAYAFLTSGIFATKADVNAMGDALRVEQIQNSVSKEDYRADITEIKIMLKDINKTVDDLKMENAKRK